MRRARTAACAVSPLFSVRRFFPRRKVRAFHHLERLRESEVAVHGRAGDAPAGNSRQGDFLRRSRSLRRLSFEELFQFLVEVSGLFEFTPLFLPDDLRSARLALAGVEADHTDEEHHEREED